jgi:hypothetical protein
MADTYSKDSSKLAKAAEELLKVACSQVEVETLASARETVGELKEIAANGTSLNQLISSLKDDISGSENSVKQIIGNLKDEINGLKKTMSDIQKDARLQWAINNPGIGSFKYYDAGKWTERDSSEFVKSVLINFRKNSGYYIHSRCMDSCHSKEEGEKEFRDALSDQIHGLIGKKPRIAMAEHGYAIYYE